MQKAVTFVFLLKLVTIFQVDGIHGTPPSLPETIFGEKTFLPEVIPKLVRRTRNGIGDISFSIDLLYSEDTHIRWYGSSTHESFMGEKHLRVNQPVPIIYSLNLSLPDSFTLTNDYAEDSSDDIFEDLNGDFIVDRNELFIKFETETYSEAAALRLSLDPEDFSDDDDKIQESFPSFPQMEEIQKDIVVTVDGQQTRLDVDVAFTNNDRYTVRSIIYNSTSKIIFANDWSTSYLGGPSDFVKTSSGNVDTEWNFKDSVIIEDSERSSELKRIIINLPTENNDISGIVKITGHSERDDPASDFILESSLEQTIIILKEDQAHGPFKAGLIQFVGGNYGRHSCVIGSTCVVSCQVLGVYVDHLKLKHKDLASEFVDVPGQHVDIGPYESVTNVAVNSTDPTFSGTYLCEAIRGPVIINKEIDVSFVNEN